MTTQILAVGKMMNKEDLDKRIMAVRGQAKEECRLALKRLEKEYQKIIKKPCI